MIIRKIQQYLCKLGIHNLPNRHKYYLVTCRWCGHSILTKFGRQQYNK